MQLIPRLWAVALLAGCTAEVVPEPEGPALDPNVASWSPPQAPLAEASRVLFLGDSITAGYGLDERRNRYASLLVENRDGAWPEWSGDDLTARYGELEVVDVSVSGSQTADVLAEQIPRLRERLPAVASGPTLIYITIGGNDLLNSLLDAGLDQVPDLIESNLREIAEQLGDPTWFPDGTLLLVTNIYEPTDGEGQVDECFFGLDVTTLEPVLDETNARSLALAQELGFAWVDLRGHFRGHGFHHDDPGNAFYEEADPTLWLQDDCIHPNRRGHHELRRLFLAATDATPFTLE